MTAMLESERSGGHYNYCIELKYRLFLRTLNNTGSVLNLQTTDLEAEAPENRSKSDGQGHQSGPLFQLAGPLSPNSDKFFHQDLFLSCFSRLALDVYQL